MSKLQHGSSDELETIRRKAVYHFAPILLREALLRLCRMSGGESLDRFEKAMVEKIDQSVGEDADFSDMKEFATEQLYACIREARSSPDMTPPVEDVKSRRTHGRSEEPGTLEDQLQKGLEDSFPASDPPAVVSTAIPGRTKKRVGGELSP
ncbi:MAG: hypothetical protein J0H34_15775 [Rhizobiales bacterium]|nr:hypothetical protein [Hyphomicrobiales bacterium]